jgi:heptosyltransferase-2
MRHIDRVLIIRLSSLGDVILSMAALEALPPGVQAEWVTLPAYAGLLEGHPRVARVWIYDKAAGLRGWSRLFDRVDVARFHRVIDLHRTLRTLLWRLRWAFSSALPGRHWTSVRKPTLSRMGYFLFKSRWPRSLRPKPASSLAVEAVSRALGSEPLQSSAGRLADLSHLLEDPKSASSRRSGGEVRAGVRLAVMPDSLWPGKCWPAARYVELFRKTGWIPVILGTPKDRASRELVDLLRSEGLTHEDAIGSRSFRELAELMVGVDAYLGSDTGLGHLADALGVPAWVIFGPTVPDMGFGPQGEKSLSIGLGMGCRPCGKDGRYCWRLERHACLKRLEAGEVLRQIEGRSR